MKQKELNVVCSVIHSRKFKQVAENIEIIYNKEAFKEEISLKKKLRKFWRAIC